MDLKTLKPILIWGLVFYLLQTVIVLFIDLLIGVYAEDLVIMAINVIVSGILAYFLSPKLLQDKDLNRRFTPWQLGGSLALVAVILELLLNAFLFYGINWVRWILMIAVASYAGKLRSEKTR